MIRGMLQRHFLFSSQLYVMWPHTDSMISQMLTALDEVLTGIAEVQQRGHLREVAGPSIVATGFARLV